MLGRGMNMVDLCSGLRRAVIGIGAGAIPVCVIGLICAVGAAHAQQANKGAPANPVGAGWQSKVNPSQQGASQRFNNTQLAAIATVNTYFNEMRNLQGRFVQIDPDQRRSKGKFYVKKPGRFRFDYASPSRKIVVSDGRFLAIQDRDLRNEDVYELDNTPFRILLRKDVNLGRDARIINVAANPETIAVTLADKDPEAPGQITVIMTMQPEVALAGWVTFDAQGLQTRIDISNLSQPDKLRTSLFKREEFFRDSIQ